METSRFLRLREIFDHAVQLPTSEWDECLVRECAGDTNLLGEARQLLAAHMRAGDSQSSNNGGDSGTKTIGAYRILRQIGEGGMGVVYLAVRDDGIFRKNVAVKVLRSSHISNDLVQRFHQERHVLASLDHPNIARILDGGQTSEGLPYYVMEFIEGLSLDKFCDTRKLDLPDRIRIFQQVVYAVHYLHENLVIHRDLKHSNILVTPDGVVKLLDFGIAKIQAPVMQAPDLTGPDQRLLTPNYASPEQITGSSLTRASDIYFTRRHSVPTAYWASAARRPIIQADRGSAAAQRQHTRRSSAYARDHGPTAAPYCGRSGSDRIAVPESRSPPPLHYGHQAGR